MLSAEGPALLVEATVAAVGEMAAAVPRTPVSQDRMHTWYEGRNSGTEQIEAEKTSMLADARLGYTTEVSVDWSLTAEFYGAVLSRIAAGRRHRAHNPERAITRLLTC